MDGGVSACYVGDDRGGIYPLPVFDILKPIPICTLERKLRGGWAIVLDDVGAALYARALFEVGRYIGGM